MARYTDNPNGCTVMYFIHESFKDADRHHLVLCGGIRTYLCGVELLRPSTCDLPCSLRYLCISVRHCAVFRLTLYVTLPLHFCSSPCLLRLTLFVTLHLHFCSSLCRVAALYRILHISCPLSTGAVTCKCLV
jgi:hypothetical protein